ncbi:MAG: site-specific integrase [Planctomycetia bacterium]|nr:site-specific integrase [Planctomycetia bacterium]
MPSEIVYMRWNDILWDECKIRICIPKKTTKAEQEQGNFKTRYIPLFPEIREALEAYRAEIPSKTEKNEGNEPIFPGMDDTERTGALLRKQLREVLRRAKIHEWPKLFMNLRANRDSELQDIYPFYIVCEWMGHSPDISLKHYTKAPDSAYRQASTRNEGK